MKKGYNREILSLLGQIAFVLVLMIGTYFIFTGSRLSSYAAVANAYGNANYDLQVLYGKDEIKSSDINILDKGVLQLRNPNNHAVTANVNFIISDNADLSNLDIIINGETLDKTNYKVNNGYYVYTIEQYELSSYEEIEYDTIITGSPYFASTFYYNYDITESFYS